MFDIINFVILAIVVSVCAIGYLLTADDIDD